MYHYPPFIIYYILLLTTIHLSITIAFIPPRKIHQFVMPGLCQSRTARTARQGRADHEIGVALAAQLFTMTYVH